MRTVAIILFLFAVSFCGFAQKMAEDYFEQGIVAYVNKDYKKSIEENRLLITRYPKLRNNLSVNKSLGLAYLQAGYFDSATTVFQKLLADTSRYNSRNYKHETGLLLAEAYRQSGKFDSALMYIYLSDTLNFYSNGCGNCIEGEMYRTTNRLVQVFEAKGDIVSEKKELLKLALFEQRYDPGLLRKLKAILLSEGNASHLKKELVTATQFVHTDKDKKTFYGYLPYIIFENTKMYLGFSYDPPRDRSVLMRRSSFYKMLMSLPGKSVRKQH